MACLDDLKAAETRNTTEFYVYTLAKLQFVVVCVVTACRHRGAN